MNRTAAIIVAAGKGTRFGGHVRKQYIEIAGKPLLYHTLMPFCTSPEIEHILVVGPPGENAQTKQMIRSWSLPRSVQVVDGGEQRHDSVMNGLAALPADYKWLLIHDGVRPFVSHEMIHRVLEAAKACGSAIVAVTPRDTIKSRQDNFIAATLDRNALLAVQTPQAFRRDIIARAYQTALEQNSFSTDDAALVEQMGSPVAVVAGDYRNIKITAPVDLLLAQALMKEESVMRIGHGYDVHAFSAGRKLILGGVDIPHEKGLLGHSDADVLCHAVSDALLGAAALGDIGRHFPDTDPAYKGADSVQLLNQVVKLLAAEGYSIVNVDVTLILQRPKIAPHVTAMRQNLAAAMGLSVEAVSVKATTNEKLGFEGREEGASCHAVALIEKIA